MAVRKPKDTPQVVPHLFYDDVGAAMDWVVEAFGFDVRLRMVDDAGTVVHGDLGLSDGGLVMFGLATENAHWECPRTLGGRVSQRLGIYVDDVDAIFERSRRAGAKIAYEPHDQYYGDRVFECIDPEGHRWKFHQVLRDVDHTTLQRPKDRYLPPKPE